MARPPTRNAIAVLSSVILSTVYLTSTTSNCQQTPNGFDGVGFVWLLVQPPAGDPREPDRDSGPVPRAVLNAFERQFKDQFRFDAPHGPELFHRVPSHPSVHLCHLF